MIGTVAGPHPYPTLVRDFQSIIGREAHQQMLAREGRLPDSLVACIGGGSNALGATTRPIIAELRAAVLGDAGV